MSTDRARAFWIAAPGRGEIRTEPLAPPAADDVVVRATYSGISRGTEALVFHGRVPASEYERMRAPFQAGDFPGPVKYGYASVGRVEQGPRELKDRDVFVPLKMAVFAPIPSASVSAAINVRPGFFNNILTPKRMSCRNVCIALISSMGKRDTLIFPIQIACHSNIALNPLIPGHQQENGSLIVFAASDYGI